MMRRRDVVLAGLAVGAVAAAEALRPRNKMKLLKDGAIEEAIPNEFASWEAHNSELITPETAGRLASSLYSEIVARTYIDGDAGPMVMVLAAYGDTQSDLLQLHRPEACYPAVGFSLKHTESVNLPIGNGALLPARRVVATMDDRVENIVYWTRMGEELPRTGAEQQVARLSNAIKGFVPDGILFRCSMVGESKTAFPVLDSFVAQLLGVVQPRFRPALIGTELSRRIA